MKCRRKPGSRRGFVCAWLAVLLGASQTGIAWYQRQADKEWREAETMLRAEGISLDLLENCPPENSGEGNFGATPLLLGVSLPEAELNIQQLSARKRLMHLSMKPASGKARQSSRIPELTAGAPVDWDAWRKFLSAGCRWEMGNQGLALQAVHECLEKRTADVLPELAAAAKNRRTAVPEPSLRQRTLRAIRKEIIVPASGGTTGAQMLPLTRCLALQMESNLFLKNPAKAGEINLVLLALLELTSHDTQLIDLLVSLSMDSLYIDCVWRCIASGVATDAMLAAASDHFRRRAKIEDRAALALQSETSGLSWTLALFSEGKYPWEAMTQFVESKSLKGRTSILERIVLPPFLQRVRASITRNYLRQRAALRSGGFPALVETVQQIVAEVPRKWPAALTHFHEAIAGGSVEALEKVYPRAAYRGRQRDAFLIICALERHRLENGTLPAALAELPQKLLPSVPLDLDGKPLRYRRTGADTWIIWSVGMNLKDDHNGNAPASITCDPAEQADWQWHVVRWEGK